MEPQRPCCCLLGRPAHRRQDGNLHVQPAKLVRADRAEHEPRVAQAAKGHVRDQPAEGLIRLERPDAPAELPADVEGHKQPAEFIERRLIQERTNVGLATARARGRRDGRKPLPVDDPKIRQPNIEKARKLLKWEPKMDLEKGLRLTIEYFKSLISKGQL